MTLIEGVDVSNMNGDPALYRDAQWYKDASFLLVQAIPRPRGDPTTPRILRTGQQDGKALGVYCWLWSDPNWRLDANVTRDMQLRLATVPDDIPLQMRPWLDFEDNVSDGWRLVSVQRRKDDVQEALDALHTWGARRNLGTPGLYISEYYTSLLFGETVAELANWLGGVPLWLAHYGRPAGSLIGGLVVGHQYASQPVDLDMMLDTEIAGASVVVVPPQDAQEEFVLIPDDYVTKFNLPDNHDITGLINNFEGVITKTREIAEAGGLDAEAKLTQIKAVLAA